MNDNVLWSLQLLLVVNSLVYSPADTVSQLFFNRTKKLKFFRSAERLFAVKSSDS